MYSLFDRGMDALFSDRQLCSGDGVVDALQPNNSMQRTALRAAADAGRYSALRAE